MSHNPLSPAIPFYVSSDDPPSKREILRAALGLFVRQGVDGTTVREIGEAAGYSNPVIFKYFDGKEDLAEHLFIACYERIATVVMPAVQPERLFAENLRELVARYAELMETDLDAFLYVSDHIRRFWPRVATALRRRSLLGLIRRLLEIGQREGAVSADVEMPILVAAMAGTLSQFARMIYFGELSADSTRWLESLEIVLRRTAR